MPSLETIGVRAVVENFGTYIGQLKTIQSQTDSVTGANTRLGSSSDNFRKLAVAAAAATAVLGTFGIAGVAAATKFQTTLAQVDALTNTSTADTKRLGDALLDLAKRVPKSPNELGAAAYFALSSGINDVDEALKVVEISAKLASAGLGETKQIVDVLTSVMNAYGKENITAAKAADILVATVREGKGEAADFASVIGGVIPIAAALGVQFDEVSALLASITNTGDNAAEAVTKVRGILNQLASPSDQAKKALAETGKFTSVMSTQFVKATATAEDLRDAELGVAEAQKKLAEAQKKSGRDSLEAQRATINLEKAQEKLASTQGKATDRVEQSADAFASLRQEIKDKGLIPTLFKLRDAFQGNIEGLAELFPDVRGFVGFLSAIESQGDATAAVLKRIRESAGLTDDVFKRMSETTAFQVGILKNQLNVALIELGNAILPTVNRVLTTALQEWPKVEGVLRDLADQVKEVARLFKLGFDQGTIGGQFSSLEKAAFSLGQELKKVLAFTKDFGLPVAKFGVTENLQLLADVLGWFIAHEAALAAIGTVGLAWLAVSNPIGAILFGGAAVVTIFKILRTDIEDLDTPLLKLRKRLDELILKFHDIATTVASLGLNKLLGLDIKAPETSIAGAARQDLAEVNDELRRREEIIDRIDRVQQNAKKSGADFATFVRQSLQAFASLGPGVGDTVQSISDLIAAYDNLKGRQGAALQDFPRLQESLNALTGATQGLNKETSQIGPTATAQTGPVDQMASEAERDLDRIKDAAGETGDEIEDVGDSARAAKRDLDQLGRTNVKPTVDSSSVQQLLDLVNKALDALRALGGAGGKVTTTPAKKAAGGPVTAGIPYIVGEQGQEIFVPSSSGYIIPNNITRQVLQTNNLSSSFIIQGATMEQQRAALHREIDLYFAKTRSTALRAGASLSSGLS